MSQPANVPLTADDRVLCIEDCLARAIIHINTAIQLYWDKNTLCAITLAGAADSLLASILRDPEAKPSSSPLTALDVMKQILRDTHKDVKEEDLSRFNLVRNANKHYESSKQALYIFSAPSDKVKENMMVDAEGQILRAIYNLELLSGGLCSTEMIDFRKTYPESPISSAVNENQKG